MAHTTVNVLHCGGEEDLSFIQQLEDAANKSSGGVRLDYTRHVTNNSKDATMIRDAQKLKKEKAPLVVLVSKTFFELIWVTSNKQGIVNVITSYSSRNCVHVWLNVDDREVQQRSKALMRKDNFFRRIKSQELQQLDANDRLDRILTLLKATGDRSNPLNNYPVDDEVEEMHRNYRASIATITKTTTDKKYKQRSNSMSYNNSSNHNNNNSNMIKEDGEHRNHRKTGVRTLADISESDIEQIALSLSRGPGANWKQLAQAFGFDAETIQLLRESNAAELARSQSFVRMLKESQGEVGITTLIMKCKQILRIDVATYIEHDVLS